MLIFASVSADLIGVVVTLVAITIGYYKWIYQYWQRKNLPFLEPSIPYGNLINPLRCKDTLGVTMRHIYDEMKKRNWKHGGIFFVMSSVYFPISLDYVKNIMAKDFEYFVDRGFYYNEKDDPLSAHLFAIGGTKWRNLRTKLTPTFTSGKMKMMFQTLVDCEVNLQEKMLQEYEKKVPLDVKEILGCFTTDIIGSCAFGLDFKTFEQENSPFRVYGKKFFNSTKFRSVKSTFASNFPELARTLGFRAVPKDVTDFFMKVVKDTVSYREKNNYTRKDFMQLLIDLKNNELAEEDGYKHDGRFRDLVHHDDFRFVRTCQTPGPPRQGQARN
jgi:cytochrome P450 family 6